MTHGIIRNTLLQLNKVMRNKQLLQSRLGKLNGLIQKQDMNVNRGGTQREYNDTQIEIKETLQDIMDIVEREV